MNNMHYAYVRVSTDKQSIENQQFEILKFADQKTIQIHQWIEETISGTKSFRDRSLGQLVSTLTSSDTLIVTELSRLGRSVMEVMSILNALMNKKVKVISIKEGYELGDTIDSKILAFAFSLSADIERKMISSRTKEALARKKQEGRTLGRPKGSLSKETKLTGKDQDIKALLQKRIPLSSIARIMGVHRLTVKSYIESRYLGPSNA
jgi:DNA invertase Pin-like site-specific DNA recombinase